MPELMIHAFSQVTSEWIAAAILVAVFASFVMERIPPEVTALGGMVAMVLTGGAIAWVVYRFVGLRLLRRAWLNLDLLWAALLVAVGVLSLVVALA
jgi:hypothetical protein